MVKSIPSTHQQTCAQTAAFLLGARPDLPNIEANEITCMHAVRNFYERMTEQSSEGEEQPCQAQLEKSTSCMCISGLTRC
jgi:hypothetical protein